MVKQDLWDVEMITIPEAFQADVISGSWRRGGVAPMIRFLRVNLEMNPFIIIVLFPLARGSFETPECFYS